MTTYWYIVKMPTEVLWYSCGRVVPLNMHCLKGVVKKVMYKTGLNGLVVQKKLKGFDSYRYGAARKKYLQAKNGFKRKVAVSQK